MLAVNFIDVIQKVFTGLYDLALALYDFISLPLGGQIANSFIVKALVEFEILGWSPFKWVQTAFIDLLDFSILESLPVFIIVGLVCLIIKHIVPF